ncbi:NAD(P)-dependent alcohol dehydrogenase [Corynebacterium suicordis]|uniref:alcohol dehydrogenase (NADP(+)) n=1 Tax=Corynebacterium suicordis DSM 45110 TaxID=1121369 RepID=A0ABR9ZGT4_9CORY|nr:NAD(P)-dependent alcohol dehydrogenase [Corynebacterium suicordis]MBF4552607.1 NAD(P)-dependent alcohol dehydrogenase [Corynebacterium suicordis DSM 45110]MDR6278435.1 putative zinc-type alcohol dehydrogenase-like protein [Corynebacterium suicordis]
MDVACYTAESPDSQLTKSTLTRRELRADDCLLEIRWAGICHSDIHTVNGDWPHENFPMTPGHEIIGTIVETGPEVQKFRTGDVVGIGCLVDSCGECSACVGNEENYCEQGATGTYNGVDRHDGSITQGGYSTHIVCREDFLIRIPEAFSDLEKPEAAAATPLLCAGITTFSPLQNAGVGKGSRVGVVGMGGLGHVAVQIAGAMGAEVTVFSHGLSKKEDGLRLGASNYVATAEEDYYKPYRESLDVIIDTVSAPHDVIPLIKMLSTKGSLVLLGLPTDAMQIPAGLLIGKGRNVTGSQIGGIQQTQEMIDFCAENNITAEVEVIPAEQINEAYERVVNSDVRYRFVIDATTF